MQILHRSVSELPRRRASVTMLLLATVVLASGCAEPRSAQFSTTAEWMAANRRAGVVPSESLTVAQTAAPQPVAREYPTLPRVASKPEATSHNLLELAAPIAPASTSLTVADREEVPKASRAMSLYGELAAAGPNAGAPLDGSTNLVQVSFATEGNCVDPDIDSTGRLVVFSSTMHRNTSDIYIKSTAGRTLTQITSDPADDVMPAFSPDGSSIAFASNRAGNWDIYITSVDGGPATQITNDFDAELHPTWSPDGRFLAFCRFGSQSARWEIWMTETANPSVKRFLDYGVFPEWCPDVARNKIVFQRAKQRGSRDYSIWTIDIHDGQASQPTEIVSAANAALINPCWSPDGGRIAFVAIVDPLADSARPQQSDVWVVNLDGSGRTNITSGQFANFQPVWAKDGSVYFVSDRSGSDNVWAVHAGDRGMANKPQPHEVANADNGAVSD